MRLYAIFLVSILCLHTMQPTIGYAEEEGATSSGATVLPDVLPKNSSSINSIIGSGSTLIDNEIYDQQSSSNTGSILEQFVEDLPEVLPISPLSIRISELAWMGSDVSSADEWVELTAVPAMTGAVQTESVNLVGWSLRIQKEGGETVIAAIDRDVFIHSGSYVVITNSAAATSRLRLEPTFISTGMTLPNTKLLLRLLNPDGIVVDEVDDYVGTPFAGSNPSAASGLPKATMERLDIRQLGTVKTNWRTAITQRGFDALSTILGTPGYLNGTVEPPDTISSPEVEHIQAFSLSGALRIRWSQPLATDAVKVRVTVDTGVYELPATATGITLFSTASHAVTLQTVDSAFNWSQGVQQPVIPLESLFISEILSDPQENNEEWIEIGNRSTEPIDLSGFTLQSSTRRFTFPQGTQIGPATYQAYPISQTGLQLPNAGGEVTLSFQGYIIDQILYTELPDGVSTGKREDFSQGVFCVPTPGSENRVQMPSITVSGIHATEPNPSSINIALTAGTGSLAGASCVVDFGDGFQSESCNPPSHRMNKSGHLVINSIVKDYCGNTITHSQPVHILPGAAVNTPLETLTKQQCPLTETGGILLTEFVAAPHIGDEWIELFNPSDKERNLCGWSLDDAVGGSNPYVLSSQSIGPYEYLVIPSSESKIALNNSADTVRLMGPNGRGGTGVVMQIPFQDATHDTSMAVRTDGVWLETIFPTPGTINRFVEPDTTPGSSPILLSAALPNPVGLDEWGEWIEITNTTNRPQWLKGWRVLDGQGNHVLLDGYVLRKYERFQLPLYRTGFSLRNTTGDIRLIDTEGRIRSVLAWQSAEEGHVVREQQKECVTEEWENVVVESSTRLRVRTASGNTLTVAMPGVEDPTVISHDFYSYKIIIENYISALIKNKKIVFKNCTNGHVQSWIVDGADLSILLLQEGFAMVDPLDTSFRHDVFLVYEREAQKERRGVWAKEQAAAYAHSWKEHRIQDAIAQRDGVTVHVSPQGGLLGTGSVITVTTNVPTELWVQRGTGAYRRFDGSIFVDDDADVSFLAMYSYKTFTGSLVRTTVSSHSYAVQRSAYPDCVRIQEVYPSPKKGEHEWVELRNSCSEDISLLGWTIDDTREGGSKPFRLEQRYVLPTNSLGVLSGAFLPIALNNSGDEVFLLSPDGQVQDSIVFTSIPKGFAVAVMAGDLLCSTQEETPSMSNKCVQKVSTKNTTKSGRKSATKQRIGLRTLYGEILFNSLFMITKNDQHKYFIEGLNTKIEFKNRTWNMYSIIAGFFFIIGSLCVIVAAIAYGRRYRLFQ